MWWYDDMMCFIDSIWEDTVGSKSGKTWTVSPLKFALGSAKMWFLVTVQMNSQFTLIQQQLSLKNQPLPHNDCRDVDFQTDNYEEHKNYDTQCESYLWLKNVPSSLKVKLSPKSNQSFICECTRVKLSCKRIIMMKEALIRFTVVSFSGKLIFSGVQGHSYASIKISRAPQPSWPTTTVDPQQWPNS